MLPRTLAILSCSLVSSLKLEVCGGGACTRNGGSVLLDAVAALGCENAALEVKATPCMSRCPSRDVVVRAAGDTKAVRASNIYQACSTATEVLEQAGAAPSEGMRSAFVAKAEGEEKLLAARRLAASGQSCQGDAQRAADLFSAALEAAPEDLSRPAHTPLDDEPLVWDESVWRQELLGDGDDLLTFAESAFTFEYAECGGATLTNCELLDEESARLCGQYEGDEGEGDFEVEMAPDGRSFRGTLTDADGEEREWLGTRVTQASGEEPPLRQRWVYEALLGRGHARLALKQPAEALEDAREATRLCCRTAEGWQLLAEAAEVCGDGEAAAAARGEAAQLAG